MPEVSKRTVTARLLTGLLARREPGKTLAGGRPVARAHVPPTAGAAAPPASSGTRTTRLAPLRPSPVMPADRAQLHGTSAGASTAVRV